MGGVDLTHLPHHDVNKALEWVSTDFARPCLDAIHSGNTRRTTAFEFLPAQGFLQVAGRWPVLRMINAAGRLRQLNCRVKKEVESVTEVYLTY
jgi:hypothetical protein